MRFFVAEIRNAGHIERSADLDPKLVLGQPPEFTRFSHPIKAAVKASMSSSDIVVSAHLRTTIGYVCSRCLENFEKPVIAEFQQVFGLDLTDFDITNDIREAIYIDLPLTPVCKEDCKGLCFSCGKNKNQGACDCKATEPTTGATQSKWDVLKQFRSK